MTVFQPKRRSKRSYPIFDRWLKQAGQLQRTTWSAIRAVSLFAGVLWLVEVTNLLLDHRLNYFGIYPRNVESLSGVLIWPFLHAGYAHLLVNSVPILVLGFFVALRSVKTFLYVTVTIQILAGLGVWLFGREAFHIGASGLVFGYFGMLVALAWFERRLPTFLIAAGILFSYGGMLWGVVPQNSFISWEGHLFGLLAGVLAANLFARTKGRVT